MRGGGDLGDRKCKGGGDEMGYREWERQSGQ